jgi:hypothetical protein
VQLEDTDQEVDENQAADLLPLWQAYQSLSNSDTTAEVELDAVVNQIQDTMTDDQIAAIAGMQLTADRVAQLIEEGALAFGRGGFGTRSGDGADGSGLAGDALRDGVIIQRPDGGPGGGGFAGGGPGGGGIGNFSEDDLATRQARFTGDEAGGFQERILTGAVIRLLQDKTGETPEPQGINAIVFAVIGEETGLTVDEIQSQTADGETLAQIIEANGADIEVVEEKLMDALGESEQFQGQDLAEFIERIFN